jgi:hypothetical protein
LIGPEYFEPRQIFVFGRNRIEIMPSALPHNRAKPEFMCPSVEPAGRLFLKGKSRSEGVPLGTAILVLL